MDIGLPGRLVSRPRGERENAQNHASEGGSVNILLALPLDFCGLNLRRRGLDALQREQPERPADGVWWVSFAFPTYAAVLTVLDNYSMLSQFASDFVAFCKVPALAGGLALCHQGLNLRVR